MGRATLNILYCFHYVWMNKVARRTSSPRILKWKAIAESILSASPTRATAYTESWSGPLICPNSPNARNWDDSFNQFQMNLSRGVVSS